ncbi:MAG: hypothetical protein RLZZ53_1970 [Acidobacteriota bacterium]|jgi:hypothetical protein
MAASIWDPAVRADFARRATKLTADTKPAWGKFHAAGMMAHLNDAYRMALGEIVIPPRKMILRYPGIKQLIIYVLPFPKGAPTAPQLLARCDAAQLADEQKALLEMFEKLGAVTHAGQLRDHPAFGSLSYKTYGALMAKHTEHHFRQFGL